MKTVMRKSIMNFQTDSFGIVHHARYLELMEEGRWQYCIENSVMDEFRNRGIYHVIVNISINYRSSAACGDLVTIETELSGITEKSVIFRHTVSRDNAVLVTAEITNVFLLRKGNSIIRAKEMAPFWNDLACL